MILAHLPAAWLLAQAGRRCWPVAPALVPLVTFAGIAPDLDLIWWALVDDMALHHHRHWAHAPAFWAVLAALILPLVQWGAPRWLPTACLCFGALFLHILQDSIVGDVMWLWPMSGDLFALFTVPATQGHWVLSFVFHWSFALELAIIFAAGLVWLGPRAAP